MRVLHVVTVADSLICHRRRSAWMTERGVETEVVASPSQALTTFGREEGVLTHGVTMRPAVTPLADLITICQLVRLLRARGPDVVHAHTPKGGLLGMIASWLARVPVRIYHIHGLVFETATGLERKLLVASEWLSCHLATQVLAVSDSILDVARQESVCPRGRGKVLGTGSINGVDLHQFSPQRVAPEADALRKRFGIGDKTPVVGFVGRLVADKGIETLAEAWRQVRQWEPESKLLIVGPWGDRDPVPERVRHALEADPRVILTGFMSDPAPAYALMTVFAFPSRREGFGDAAVEASALGVPVVGSRIPGLSDAVADGLSGTLVTRDAPHELADALQKYLANPDLAALHGRQGRKRVEDEFDPERIWNLILHEYEHFSVRARTRRAHRTLPGLWHAAVRRAGPGRSR